MRTYFFILISFLFTIFPGTAFSDEITLETIPQDLSYTLNVIYEKANCQTGEDCSPHTIGLRWNHPLKTDGLQTYSVYKNDEKQPDQVVFNPSNATVFWADTDIQWGAHYCYRISASYTEGESYLSEPLCLTVGQRIYSLPDSPDAFEYDTYFEKNWYALTVDDSANINKVRLQYQWEATENPTPCTIESITPFGKMWMINEAGEPNGFYEKSIGIFSSYPVTGEWLFYVVNFLSGNGGATVKKASLIFDYIPSNIQTTPQNQTIIQNLSYNLDVSYAEKCEKGWNCSQKTKIILRWNHLDKTDGLKKYTIYRNDEIYKTLPVSSQTSADSPIIWYDTNTFQWNQPDPTVQWGQQYCYKVRASYMDEDDAGLSEPLCITVGQRVFTLPDSPDNFSYDTYFENNWYELDVKDLAKIEKVTIHYQWNALENPTPCTFECISPNQQMWFINDAGDSNGFYEKSTPIFSTSPVTGKWYFYLGNFATGNGGAKVKQVSITFDYIPPYLESEKEALVELYYAHGGSFWFNPTYAWIHWNLDSPCDFIGVECGPNNRVVEIDLREFGLKIIPDSIKNLTDLNKMKLSSNQLKTISSEIGQLKQLEVLDLSDNPLTDLPDEIFSLTNLKNLNLSHISLRQLSSEIKNLYNLETLDISFNQLDEIPPEISLLTHITHLNIAYNQLTDIPPEMGLLSHLVDLNISYNQITAIPSEIGLLTHLSVFNVSHNQLTTIPSEIGRLTNLNVFHLSDNQLQELPPEIGQLKKLHTIDISSNKLKYLPSEIYNLTMLNQPFNASDNLLTEISSEIEKFKYINILDLSQNLLTHIPKELGSLYRLEKLYLQDNKIDSFVCDSGSYPSLILLDLSSNLISSVGFYGMASLKSLNLSENNLDSNPVSYDKNLFFEGLCSLVELNLSKNDLNVFCQETLKLNSLERLNLSENRMYFFPNKLSDLPALQELDLSKINVTEINGAILPIEENFSGHEGFKSLQMLDLSNNTLQPIPGIKHFENLKQLKLNNCVISKFPEEITELTNLVHLEFRINFVPEIPDTIANLKHLNYFDISYSLGLNAFPESICWIPNLQYFNLSQSNLSGDIPTTLINLNQLTFINLSQNMLFSSSPSIQSFINEKKMSLWEEIPTPFPVVSERSDQTSLSVSWYITDTTNDYEKINYEICYSPMRYAYFDHGCGETNSQCQMITSDSSAQANTYLSTKITDLSPDQTYFFQIRPHGLLKASEFVGDFYLHYCGSFSPEVSEPDFPSISKIYSIEDKRDKPSYGMNEQIPIIILFNQPVTLADGNLNVTLDTGQVYTISTIDNADSVTINYSVASKDYSNDLNVQSIALPGGTLTNVSGKNVDLTIPKGGNLKDLQNIMVDGQNPLIRLEHPQSQTCLDKLNLIQGTAYDQSGHYDLEIQIGSKENYILIENHAVVLTSENKWNPLEPSENWSFDTSMITWSDNTTYTISVKATDFSENTSIVQTHFSYGHQLSSISCHLSRQNMVLGERITISGKIELGGSDDNFQSENVTGKEIYVNLVPPEEKPMGSTVNARADGSFEYQLQCDDIHKAGTWRVFTRWNGTDCLTSAESDSVTLSVSHAPSRIVLDSTYSSVKLGDTVGISGKVINKYKCANHMTDIPILVEMSRPDNSANSEFIALQTIDNYGSFQATYSNFNVLGKWELKAIIGEKTDFGIFSDAHAYTVSEMLEINVVETAGYAIIVQGKIASEEGLTSHNKTTNDVYHSFKQRGLMDEDILYFNYDNDQASYKITNQTIEQLFADDVPENIISLLKQEDIFNKEYQNEVEFITKLSSIDEQILAYQSQILTHSSRGIEVDGRPTKNAIKKAIIEDIPKIMGNMPANLYIVLVDHGNEDTFYIEPDIITDSELNEWLTELEGTPGWSQEIIVMLGFCFSGSFIDELSKPNRIIISSAGPDEFSYKGPLDQDNIREGEYFISEFFKSMALGKNIHESFSKAAAQTKIFTALGDGSVNAPPYFDNSAQHPLLDDNGDKVGSNHLIEIDRNYVQGNENDGVLSHNITIGVSSLTMNDPGDVMVTDVSDPIFLRVDETTTDNIWASVNDNQRLLTLWIEIKPPDFVPNAAGTGQVEMDLPRIIKSRYDTATDRYYWDSEDLENTFDIPGTYHIYYFAKDTDSKNVSPMKESIVYKASSVNHPPDNFELLYPSNDIEITSLGVLSASSDMPTADSYTMLAWEDSKDPDNDRVIYTLWFKKDNDQFKQAENRIVLANLTNNFQDIHLPNDWDGSTVYWKVQAIDSYGAIQNSTVNRFMINNANNPSNGTLWGYVYDAATNKPVQRVGVAVKSGGSLIKRMMTMSTGKYFSAFRPLSNYHIVVEKEGYEVIEKSPVSIPKDDRCRLDFYLVADTSNIPQLSEISSQTINEGESFVPISLDNYITDGNNEKHEITWSASGNTELNVTIDDSRIASITVSNKDWFGAETIIFSAEDPEGNKVDTSATFTIKGVNDAPVVTNIPDQIIYDYATFQPIILDNCVIDVDHAVNEITWETMGQKNLMVSIKDRIAKISLRDKQWRGYENIMFTATDPSGDFGVKMAMFTVLNSGFVYDLNNNGRIDLGDMIMVLQIFTNVYVDKEWISDQQIGFDDLLLIMNRISKIGE
jgi:Leucine-rich repeat (LRR) protein